VKDESKGVLIKSYVGIRSKVYSILSVDSNSSKITAKGVKRGFAKRNVKREMFVKTLKNRTCTHADFMCFRSKSLQIVSLMSHRVCVSAHDNKRFVNNDDGVSTLAYGHIWLRPPVV